MTTVKQIGGVRIVEIANTPHKKCECCGKVDELRPYGKNGANVCFDCAMQDKAEAERRFHNVLFGGH